MTLQKDILNRIFDQFIDFFLYAPIFFFHYSLAAFLQRWKCMSAAFHKFNFTI